MKYRNLGKTGLKVSRLCMGMMSFGCKSWRSWVLDEEAARPIVRKAFESGINFFDTADFYSSGTSEIITGKLLREIADRDEVVIASKVFFPTASGPNGLGLSRKHIMSALDASLRRLGTDYIDIYQIHRWDFDTPVEETLRALDDAVRSGKVRYIGASSMMAWQFAKALFTSDLLGAQRFISMQSHYNLLYREEEREMFPLCQDQGIGVMAWSPLARGALCGNRGPTLGSLETARAHGDSYAAEIYSQEGDGDVVRANMELAKQMGVSPASLALAWILSRPACPIPVLGTTKLTHLDDALSALELTIPVSVLEALERRYRPHPVLGHSIDGNKIRGENVMAHGKKPKTWH